MVLNKVADVRSDQSKSDVHGQLLPSVPCPLRLRWLRGENEILAGLEGLAGYDADLAAQSTRLTNPPCDALPL